MTYTRILSLPTPEQERAVLACIDHAGGQATPAALATHLGVTIPGVRPLLDHLQGRGLIRFVRQGLRSLYERTNLTPNPELVRDEYRAPIRTYLQGRTCMPLTMARTLKLPEDEVRETCKAMVQDGELIATPVGATFVYRLSVAPQLPLADAS